MMVELESEKLRNLSFIDQKLYFKQVDAGGCVPLGVG